jgi:hypothetical protein
MTLLEELAAESARRTANREAAMRAVRKLLRKGGAPISSRELVEIVARRARVPESAVEVAISELTIDREVDYDGDNNLFRV